MSSTPSNHYNNRAPARYGPARKNKWEILLEPKERQVDKNFHHFEDFDKAYIKWCRRRGFDPSAMEWRVSREMLHTQ